jgi:5-methylcytosine-specific restriction endonuclease McrA
MLTSCLGCGAIIPMSVGKRCPSCAAVYGASERARLAALPMKRVYSQRQWRRVRQQALARAGFVCETCGSSQQQSILDCHHIVSLEAAPELAYELSNLRVECRSCHVRRQHRERRRAQ